jgi:hypothetical protein
MHTRSSAPRGIGLRHQRVQRADLRAALLVQGARPAITSAPAEIAYGEQFAVNTPIASDIAAAALIKLSTVTHSANTGQRYADVTFSAGGSDVLNLTAPSNANLAPPGHYMLFLLNSAGVPSVAQILHLGS